VEMCFDICIYTSIQQLNMHYDFLIKTMFGSSLSPVLFRLCQYVLCFSLDCPFFIAASVFSNVYYYYLYMYSCFPLVGPKLAIKYSYYTCTGTCCKPAHIIIWLEKNLVLLLDYQKQTVRGWIDLTHSLKLWFLASPKSMKEMFRISWCQYSLVYMYIIP
jgi:hypothetical protein